MFEGMNSAYSWPWVLCLPILLLYGCTFAQQQSPDLVNVVGEIFHDETVDDQGFKLCHNQTSIIQYYAFDEKTFEGEKSAIDEHFFQHYRPVNNNESGLVRIRFVVNCEGNTGRFRMLSMGTNYERMTFSREITDQLMSLTKDLDGWKPMEARETKRDYYQYLIFKIRAGALIEIMP